MSEPAESPEDALTRTVGARIREAREARGTTLRSLAATVGVSPGMLSQLETGRARPSVGTLWALVSELGLSLDAVFPDGGVRTPPLAPVVQRAGARDELSLSGGVTWEQLGSQDDAGVVFAHVTYLPGEQSEGGASELPLARHRGREYGYLLSGRLAIEVGGETVELGPGDAISFGSDVPHRFHALGEEPARAVWFNRVG